MRGKLRAIIAIIVMSVSLSLCGETLKKLGQWGSQDFTGMVVDGRYAYCVTSYVGLEIIDVSDRTHPVRVSGIEIPSYVADVCSGNGYVYISAEGSLEIIDVHDPVHPTQRSRMTLGKYGNTIAWQKGYVYMIVQGGLAVVNVIDPDHPRQIALVPGSYTDFCVRNNYIYATSSTFCIINVSIPSAPFIAGSIGFENMSFGQVRLMGDHVFLSGTIYEPHDDYSEKHGGQRARNANEAFNETWFGIFNIADPTRPYKVWESNVYRGGFCVQDNYIYFSDGRVLNVTYVSQPVAVGKFDFKTIVSNLVVDRHFMYGSTDNGFVIVSIEQPGNPKLIGSYDECGSALGVWVDGQKACLSFFNGIRMLDAANPMAPKLMWSYFEPDKDDEFVEWGMIRGTYLHLLYRKSSLHFWNFSWKIVDVSDPLHPHSVWEIPLYPEEGVHALKFKGRFVFVTIHSGWATVVNRMEIYDVSDPSRPVLVSRADVTSDYSRALDVNGGYAYVFTDVDNMSHLSVFDVSNPFYPKPAGSLDVNQMMLDVVISYPFAYGVGWNHAKGFNELQIFGLWDPIHPLLLGSCELGPHFYLGGYRVSSLYLWGHYVYVAGLEEGLLAVDVSDPAHPKEVASFEMPGGSSWVHGEGNRIYASSASAGRMYILEAIDSADTNLYLYLTGLRKADRGWILHPNYAELDIRIWNRNDRPVSRYVLSRAETGGAYAIVKEISPEEIANEMYHCRDVGLKTNMKYRYKVEALDNQGAVIAASNEITI